MAERLAALKGYVYAGDYDPILAGEGPLYFVPNDTLPLEQARELGIRSVDDLFGGVVQHPFASTKSITHPLVDGDATMPTGWSERLASRLRDVVLPGYAVFDRAAARRAVIALLARGSVRVKPAMGIGGAGQTVIDEADQLDAALQAISEQELAAYGAVLEQNLAEVTTYSVGLVELGGSQISYVGTQRLTPNHRGQMVYGGSVLNVVRGGFASLVELPMDRFLSRAVELARRYDKAALEELPGFLASRRNYDVAMGRDREGHPREGVLEQSWRIGGASPAEIGAAEAFAADPTLRHVQAASYESYASDPPPPQAVVHFQGMTSAGAPLVKYSVVERYADTT